MNTGKPIAENRPDKAPALASSKRKLTPRVAGLLAERNGLLPVFVRSPKGGTEHYSGLTRGMLYRLDAERKIRSVSIREPGALKGCRLFDLGSILSYLDSLDAEPTNTDATTAGGAAQ